MRIPSRPAMVGIGVPFAFAGVPALEAVHANDPAFTSELTQVTLETPDTKDVAAHRCKLSPPSREGGSRLVGMRVTAGKWTAKWPSRCPNGHTLGPNQVLVSHVACLSHGGGGPSWHCRI